MSSVNGMQSSIPTSAYMDYSVSVAAKAKGVVSQEGQAALALIDSAAAVSNASGANGGASRPGSFINVVV